VDLIEAVQRAFDRVMASIVSTADEMDLAARLLDGSKQEDEGVRRLAIRQLLDLEEHIAMREQGRTPLLIPRDPNLAAPLLTGLDQFAQQIGNQLDDQIIRVSRERRCWLGVSIGASILTICTPAILVYMMLTNRAAERISSAIPLVGLLVAGAVLTGILAFRVFQSSDETQRRLREKRVSLTFLKASVDLRASAPGATQVLERSFDMFLRHYEGPHTPVKVGDIWPSVSSK
jgi:hypothetical protein